MENLFILILIAVVVLFIINLNTVEAFEDGNNFKSSSNPTIDNSLSSIIDSALSNNTSKTKDVSDNVSNVKKTQLQIDVPKQSVPDNSGILPNSAINYDSVANYNDNYTLDANTKDPKYVSQSVKPRENLKTKDLLPGKPTEKWFDSYSDLFDLDKAISIEVPEMKFGIDTVGQSKKNASRDIRVAPPCPKFVVSPWNNSTIEPDYNIKSLC